MLEDEEGFLYPKVDESLCISCDLCLKVCPVQHPVTESRKPLKTLAALSKDEAMRVVSSSGGVFSLLATSVLTDGGRTWGAAFDINWKVVHKFVDKKEKLSLFRGAKYLQSDVSHSFREVEHCLKEGRKVLFSGTPCQVAGLRNYLRKEYKNLYTVDLVCHGVPSFKVFKAFLNENFGDRTLADISFRDKTTGWKSYNLCIKYWDDGVLKEKKILRGDNVYMQGFISNLYLRPSCYKCPVKCGKSGSDITLGDFWGIEKEAPEMDDAKGTSLILLNTQKGEELFSLISSSTNYKELSYESAYRENESLEKSSQYNSWRSIFFEDLEDKPFSDLVHSFDAPSLMLRIRRKIADIKRRNG